MISKKKQQEIKRVSFYNEVLKEYLGRDYFADTRPDMWSKDETKLFDMITNLEEKIKEAILKIL